MKDIDTEEASKLYRETYLSTMDHGGLTTNEMIRIADMVLAAYFEKVL